MINEYNISVVAVDNFEYKPEVINNVKVSFPKPTTVDISKLLMQLTAGKVDVYVTEYNKDVYWVKLDIKEGKILIFNMTNKDFGVHILTISIYDYCFGRYFNSYLVVEIYPHNPPTVVGTISNLTAYICFKILKLKTLYKLSMMLILLKIIDIWHACQ